MARKPTRSQLNQIRAWVRQGRTEAWIAHQLEVSASELRDFIRRNDLEGDEDASDVDDLRDEIEAEIEATMDEEEEDEPDEDEEEDSDEDSGSDGASGGRGGDGSEQEGSGRRRRRRRRRRGGKRVGVGLEATFDHGDDEGYGLWLDPAVEGDPIYSEHWKGKRKVEVTIEPDQILIRRSGE